MSLLASLKPGGRGGSRRARENRIPGTVRLAAGERERSLSGDAAESGRQKRYWLWLDIAMTGLWVALLLSVVAYAVIEGETAMAQLDGLDLVAARSTSR